MVAKKKEELEDKKEGASSVKEEGSTKKKVVAKKAGADKKKTSAVKKTASKKLKESVRKVKEDDKKNEENVTVSAAKTSIASIKKTSSVSILSRKNVAIVETKGVAGKSVGKIGEVRGDTAFATGHRKRAIAKVACQKQGNKPVNISVNKIDYKSYFTNALNQKAVYAPFALIGVNTGFVVRAEVFGGGKSGQADALKLGISRCLSLLSEEFNSILRKNSFLTRDSRKVEQKKAGLRKARKKEQFSKR